MKKIIAPVLVYLFVHLFLSYLWPSFRDRVFDYEWYLNYSGDLEVISTSLSIVLLFIAAVLGVKYYSTKQPAPGIIIAVCMAAFLCCVISVAIKNDILYYF